MIRKSSNQKAWLFVLPVVALVAFNALIPLMTVVNYSVQETFGDNVFFWEGVKWYEQVLNSERFHARCWTPADLHLHHPDHRGAARRRVSRSPCRARESGCRSAWS